MQLQANVGPGHAARLDLHCGLAPPHGESWLTAALPVANPYCSCKPTRVQAQDNGIAHVWHTVSSAKGVAPHNHIVLAANITRATNISVAELRTNAAEIVTAFGRDPIDNAAAYFLAREYYSGETREVSPSSPLALQPQKLKPGECAGRGFTHEYCTPFELWTLTPIPLGHGEPWPAAAIPMENPYGESLWRIPMENPYCSC